MPQPTCCCSATDSAWRCQLLTQLEHAVTTASDAGVLARHLEGIAAIMESHFRYEERQLDGILSDHRLDAAPQRALGGL